MCLNLQKFLLIQHVICSMLVLSDVVRENFHFLNFLEDSIKCQDMLQWMPNFIGGLKTHLRKISGIFSATGLTSQRNDCTIVKPCTYMLLWCSP